MPDILRQMTQAEQLDFSRNFLIPRPNYIGDVIFPDRKTQNFKAEYLRLAAGYQLPTMALVHGLDTESHIASRPPLERVTVEKLFVKEKINQGESLRMVLENGVYEESDLIDYVFDDWARLAEGVRCRTEVAKMEVLSSGAMTIKENGLNFAVDFGVPAANKAFTIDLSDPSVDALGQIQAIVDAARDTGMTISGAVTSSAVLTKLLTNEGISRAIHGGAGAGAMVTRSQMGALFDELYGFHAIATNDLRYNVEGKNGKPTPNRFYPRDKITFLASFNGLQDFGVGLWGVTPEESTLGPWTDRSADLYITLTQWSTPDPVTVWSKASALFVPILPNPNGLFVASVTLV